MSKQAQGSSPSLHPLAQGSGLRAQVQGTVGILPEQGPGAGSYDFATSVLVQLRFGQTELNQAEVMGGTAQRFVVETRLKLTSKNHRWPAEGHQRAQGNLMPGCKGNREVFEVPLRRPRGRVLQSVPS